MPEHPFILSCESTVDLPYAYVAGRDIPILFYSYTIDGETFIDDMGRDPASIPTFYRKLDAGALPTTAHDFSEFLRVIKGPNIEVQVLFLEASDSVLLHRYKSTRRTHPLLLMNTANTLEEAIAVERQMFARNINNSFITIDTSFLSDKEFRKKIEQYFAKSSVPSFSLSFVSFGYKYGVPMDADLMVDVRFLPNPFWVVRLRPFSGNDEEVYNYVMDKPETKEFLERLLAFTDYAFEQYVK